MSFCVFFAELTSSERIRGRQATKKSVFNRIQRNEKRSEEEEWRGEGVLQGAISSGSDDPALRVGDADTDDKECNPSPPGLFRNQTGSSVTSDLTSSSEYTGDTKKSLAYPASLSRGRRY